MMPTTPREEPTDALQRVEHYRRILAQIPEYHELTQGAQQFWTVSEAEEKLHLSPSSLRQAFADGYLPGAIPGSGRRGMEIPRSALILHIGRLVTGWYDSQNRVAESRQNAG